MEVATFIKGFQSSSKGFFFYFLQLFRDINSQRKQETDMLLISNKNKVSSMFFNEFYKKNEHDKIIRKNEFN